MRYTIIFILCLSSTISYAQETPDYNLDFEQWEDSTMQVLKLFNDADTFIENGKQGILEGWGKYGGFTVRTTDAFNGDYAIVLYDWYGINRDYVSLGENGDPNPSGCGNCGTSISFRPESISFAYKGILTPSFSKSDTVTGKIMVYLTKYDSLSGHRDTIGIGKINLLPTSDKYKTYKIPFQYSSQQTPDSIILLVSLNEYFNHCIICALMFFDNFEFHRKGTSVISPEGKSLLHIYPNPLDKSELNILNKSSSRFISVKMYNSSGVFISEITIPPHSQRKYSMSGLENGIYYLKGEERTYKVVHF